jgi:hypothetical protein
MLSLIVTKFEMFKKRLWLFLMCHLIKWWQTAYNICTINPITAWSLLVNYYVELQLLLWLCLVITCDVWM